MCLCLHLSHQCQYSCRQCRPKRLAMHFLPYLPAWGEEAKAKTQTEGRRKCWMLGCPWLYPAQLGMVCLAQASTQDSKWRKEHTFSENWFRFESGIELNFSVQHLLKSFESLRGQCGFQGLQLHYRKIRKVETA